MSLSTRKPYASSSHIHSASLDRRTAKDSCMQPRGGFNFPRAAMRVPRQMHPSHELRHPQVSLLSHDNYSSWRTPSRSRALTRTKQLLALLPTKISSSTGTIETRTLSLLSTVGPSLLVHTLECLQCVPMGSSRYQCR